MKFTLQINSSPTAGQNGYYAYRFVCELIAAGHQVIRIFFYKEGIYHGYRYSTPPDDELNFSRLWSALSKEHAIDLVICVSAAQRRGLLHPDEAQRQGKLDNDLTEGFRISGLGQMIEASLLADRLIVFP
ncbi:MAG: sulfurtransferase complex subunit TusD [Methylicorpusculum sp.]|uniref:sulfurtransferase complex subunit TusD n=1 Tax=Methylicorpusculum sp. TaxID=2713644 RepID=UPI00271BEC6B|nr:sulfurtransferase complex subunit TusD [Methylicorpusculum sp.]MDO8938851.1 sulfurtransferase complex subunit TusD [Methylicorpusculum sp.]MDO9238785.1 sulfurtransferase complex subunit TusD [Methylicorpusculum sp.]MDP2180119.1 sulfurtransferase complex subunit TusD [Methylicorpusculum sp.]MDP2201550.1 sulfurtransferase complex subunit TusD [Methylicorpusculum sp.]MDP3530672.1 sulfurtransferase complex subunit TusD [Methylicorpusculum sp.]